MENLKVMVASKTIVIELNFPSKGISEGQRGHLLGKWKVYRVGSDFRKIRQQATFWQI